MASVRVMRDGIELAIEDLPMQRAAQGDSYQPDHDYYPSGRSGRYGA